MSAMSYPGPVGPAPHHVRTWQDAELNAARWMQHWGFTDAAVTPGGADGGIDVRASYALAQVNFVAAAVGRPDLQRLVGAAAAEPGRQLIFFTGSDYTTQAVDFADGAGIALFRYGLDGSMTPYNATGHRLMERGAAAPSPSASSAWQPHPAAAWQAAPAPGPQYVLPPRAPTLGDRFKAGGWYFVVPIASSGIFAAVPFWHAAVRLGRPALWRPALFFSATGFAFLVINGLIPKDAAGDPIGGAATLAQNAVVAAALVLIVVACFLLRPLKREVYGPPAEAADRPATTDDPTVARALERRSRRAEARALVEKDRGLARELGIGRPDLGRGYDDGGLVDVNTASAELLARVCDMDLRDAERVVEARALHGGRFFSMGDVFVDVALPLGAEEELRERGIAL